MLTQVEGVLQNKNMVFLKSQLVPGHILHLPVDNDRGDDKDDGEGELKDHQAIPEDQPVPVRRKFSLEHQRGPERREDEGGIQTGCYTGEHRKE